MLYRVIQLVAVCWQNVGFLSVAPCGAYSNHWGNGFAPRLQAVCNIWTLLQAKVYRFLQNLDASSKISADDMKHVPY